MYLNTIKLNVNMSANMVIEPLKQTRQEKGKKHWCLNIISNERPYSGKKITKKNEKKVLDTQMRKRLMFRQ